MITTRSHGTRKSVDIAPEAPAAYARTEIISRPTSRQAPARAIAIDQSEAAVASGSTVARMFSHAVNSYWGTTCGAGVGLLVTMALATKAATLGSAAQTGVILTALGAAIDLVNWRSFLKNRAR